MLVPGSRPSLPQPLLGGPHRYAHLPLGSAQRRKVGKHTDAMLSFTSENLPCPETSQGKSVNEVAATVQWPRRETAAREPGQLERSDLYH